MSYTYKPSFIACLAITVMLNTISIIVAAHYLGKINDRLDYHAVRLLEVMQKVKVLENKK